MYLVPTKIYDTTFTTEFLFFIRFTSLDCKVSMDQNNEYSVNYHKLINLKNDNYDSDKHLLQQFLCHLI
jgi:hypothetical protein